MKSETTQGNSQIQFIPMAIVGDEYEYTNGIYMCKTLSIDFNEYGNATFDGESTITISTVFIKVK